MAKIINDPIGQICGKYPLTRDFYSSRPHNSYAWQKRKEGHKLGTVGEYAPKTFIVAFAHMITPLMEHVDDGGGKDGLEVQVSMCQDLLIGSRG